MALLAGCGSAHERTSSVGAVGGFAVFAAPATADDRLPADVASSLSRSVVPEFSASDVRAARRVLADKPGWLVPSANGEVCLVDLVYPTVPRAGGVLLAPSLTEDCAPRAQAREGAIVETQSLGAASGARTVRLLGIAADGVKTVTVSRRDGAQIVIGVVRNAYEVAVDDPVAVSFVLHRGRSSQTRTLPVQALAARYSASSSRPKAR